MKLFVRGIFTCTVVVAGMVLTGCSSPSPDPLLGSAPTRGVANAANVARFHVGDAVTVSFSGSPTSIPEHAESIKEDGTLTLPLIGPIYALGKTAGELQNEIYTNYVPKYYVRLTVTVISGNRVFYVGGEVNSHGQRMQYTDGLTVTKGIQAAGGLTDFASHGKVWLIRANGGQRIQVDYDEALKTPAKDPPVYPDDQIIVGKKIF
jgi:protein involved in polysaccharide export with SLBB domain